MRGHTGRSGGTRNRVHRCCIGANGLPMHFGGVPTPPWCWGCGMGHPASTTPSRRWPPRPWTKSCWCPFIPNMPAATRTTTIERAKARVAGSRLLVLPPFYDRPEYLQAMRHLLSQELPKDADHLLFSYHGLPERQIRKARPNGQPLPATPRLLRGPLPRPRRLLSPSVPGNHQTARRRPRNPPQHQLPIPLGPACVGSRPTRRNTSANSP